MLKEWPCGASGRTHPGHQSQVHQGVPLWAVCTSCCSWATAMQGVLVGWADSQPGWF